MIPAFTAALRQLNDPPVQRVIWQVALWTVAIFAALGWALWSAVANIETGVSLDFIPWDWLRDPLVWLAGVVIALIGGFVVFALFWLLFASVVQVVSGFYLERVIAAVEARHYPELPPPASPTVAATLTSTLRFFAALVLLNLLLVPVYLIPTVGLVAFYLLNGYLLGRENFELVAMRRLDGAALRGLRRRHRGQLLGAGLIVTVLLSLPVLNLVAPIVAVAATVHLFARMTEDSAALSTETA
ncbi:MAG: EI24 domain-containing protein [Alphaproteobacteria bacterium]